MAHSGSIIAAGLGKGRVRLPCGKKRVSVCLFLKLVLKNSINYLFSITPFCSSASRIFCILVFYTMLNKFILKMLKK